jgi:flagellin FlaB
MKTESKQVQEDNVAAIGIGAMIVFIALILVAAVAAAVIIQTAEKLQQNAETTGADTAKNLAGKFVVFDGFVANGGLGGEAEYTSDTAYFFTATLAPGSTPIRIDTITYQMFCDAGKIEGIFGTHADVQEMDSGDDGVLTPNVELQPKQQYVLWVTADKDGIDCAAGNAEGDTTIDLSIHIGTGGSTHLTLNVDSVEAGARVV